MGNVAWTRVLAMGIAFAAVLRTIQKDFELGLVFAIVSVTIAIISMRE